MIPTIQPLERANYGQVSLVSKNYNHELEGDDKWVEHRGILEQQN